MWTLCLVSLRAHEVATEQVSVSLRNGGAALIAASERDFSPHDCLLRELFKEQ